MENRRPLSVLIAVVLAGYGLYVATALPAMLVAPAPVLLLIGGVLQTVLALVAAVGVWRGRRWAAGVVVALGVTIALTWLAESFLLGLTGYRPAVLVSLLAIGLAVVTAMYLDDRWKGKRSA